MSAFLKRRARRHDERGAILILATVGLVLAMIAGGLAVDLGSLAHEARFNQKVADLAALDALRVLPVNPTAAAQESAVRNSFPYTEPGHALVVEWASTKAGPFSSDAALLPVASVVRVTATSPHTNDFPFVGGGQTVTRKGLALRGPPIGAVRVGSSAVTVDSSATIMNRLLTQTVGGSYNLSAVGWNGLANGNVNFQRLRTALGFAAGSPDGVLDADFKFRRVLDATVDALNADGSPSSLAAATFLAQIAAQVDANAGLEFKLRRLFDIVASAGNGNEAANATINVRDIVTGGMTLADGDNFATLNLSSADVCAGLPSPCPLAGTSYTVKFGLIEAPQMKIGPPKDSSGTYLTVATTGQIKLLIELNLNVELVPLTPGLLRLALKVPYYFEGAAAQGKLDTLYCAGGPEPTSVDIFGVTQVATSYVGTVSDASLATPGASAAANVQLGALSVNLGLLLGTVGVTVTTTGTLASATVPGHSGMRNFTPPYDGATSQTIPGATVVPLPSLATSNITVGLTGLGTTLLSLGLSTSSITNLVLNAISPLLTPLNNNLVAPLTGGLGLSLGAGDLWAPPPQTCNAVPTLAG